MLPSSIGRLTAGFLLLCAVVFPAYGATVPSSVSLGVILPLTGDQSRHGVRAKVMLDLLLNDLNTGVALPGLSSNPLGVPLTLAYRDSHGDPVTAMKSVYDLQATVPDLVGLIGDWADNVTLPLAVLTNEMQIPLISPGATTPSLASADYPYFFRSILSDELFANMWTQSLLLIGWKRVAILSSDDDNGKGFVDVLLRQIAVARETDPETNVTSNPFDVNSVVFPTILDDITDVVINNALDALMVSNYRIFLLHANELNERILRLAYAKGMMGVGTDGILRQWFGEFCTPEIEQTFQDSPEILFGSVCVTRPWAKIRDEDGYPTSQAELALEARLKTAAPTVFTSQDRLDYQDLATANAFIAWVTALEKWFHDSSIGTTSTDLRDMMLNHFSFQAFDGSILPFLPNGEIHQNPVFVNWNVDQKAFLVTATYDLVNGGYNVSQTPVIFMSGLSDYPKDRARIYVTNDHLPQSWDGKIVVLTYVVAVLGAWTALILLEQSLSFWSRGGWKQALGWTLLASVAFGTCSIFPTFVMNFTALILDSDARLWFTSGGPITLAAIYPFLGTTIAFYVALLSVQGGLKPAANVNINEVSDVSTTSQTSKSDSNSKSDSRSKTALRMIRSSMNRTWNKLKEFSEIIVATTWKLPLAAIVLTVVVSTEHLVVNSGFYIKAHLTTPIGVSIGAWMCCFFLNLLSLIMYFHVTRSAMRYAAPFLLAASTFAEFFIVQQDSLWKYDSTVDILHEAVADKIRADTSLAVIVAVITSGICLAGMAFNVNRLRMSRNTLDKVLTQVAGQVRGLEADIEYEKSSTEALNEQSDFFRRTMEVINLCRPIWRPYAIAMALADPDTNIQLEKDALHKPLLNDKVVAAALEKDKAEKAAGQGKDAKGAEKVAEKGAEKAAKSSGGHKTKKSSLGGPASGGDLEPESPSASSVGAGAAAATEEKAAAENSKDAAAGRDPSKPLLVASKPEISAASAGDGGSDKKENSLQGKTGSVISGMGAGGSTTLATATDKKGSVAFDVPASTTLHSSGASSSSNLKEKAAAAATTSDWQRIHAPKQGKQLAALLKELQEMGNLEGPVPSRTIADIKLPQIMSHPATLELMKDVLSKNLSPENIALWIDIQRYRSLENAQVRKAVADEIFQTFIVTGAKFEVNLSSFMRDWVQTCIYKNKITVDMFDEVEREIYRLMITNNVDTLVNSQMFKLSALLLQHPLYKLKSMSLVNNVRGEIGGNVPSTIGLVAAQPGQQTGTGGSNNSQGRASTPVQRAVALPRVSPSPLPDRKASVLPTPSAVGTPRSNNFTGTGTTNTPR